MNLLEIAMARRRGTYGCDAARKKLGEETVVQGAVRGSGEFSPALLMSPARQGRKGEIAAASTARLEFSKWEVRGRRRGTPAPLFIAPRW